MNWLKQPRFFLCVGLTLLCALAQGKELRIYNWTDYIDPALIQKFSQETGIKVIYDTFDSNDVLLAKTLSGNSGYDIVVPSDYTVAYLIQAKQLLEIDKTKIPNLKNIWPFATQQLSKFKGMNDYSVPYFWGTTGIAYDAKKIDQLVPDAPKDSYELLLNPKYAQKLASCGIYVLDNPSEVIPLINLYVGNPAESTKTEDLAKVKEVLDQIRPYIKKFHSSEYISALAKGDACLALGWSGDVFLAKSRAKEAHSNVDIEYFIPKEGSVIWFDQFAILKDAKNVDEAYAFINFMLDAQNNAVAANYVEYATSNKAALEYVAPYLKEDKVLYPNEEFLSSIHNKQPYTLSEQKKITRFWLNYKNQK